MDDVSQPYFGIVGSKQLWYRLSGAWQYIVKMKFRRAVRFDPSSRYRQNVTCQCILQKKIKQVYTCTSTLHRHSLQFGLKTLETLKMVAVKIWFWLRSVFRPSLSLATQIAQVSKCHRHWRQRAAVRMHLGPLVWHLHHTTRSVPFKAQRCSGFQHAPNKVDFDSMSRIKPYDVEISHQPQPW